MDWMFLKTSVIENVLQFHFIETRNRKSFRNIWFLNDSRIFEKMIYLTSYRLLNFHQQLRTRREWRWYIMAIPILTFDVWKQAIHCTSYDDTTNYTCLFYSQLSPCGHPAITDTPLLRTGAKSPVETAKKCMEIIPAITDSALTELRILHVVPKKYFYCFTFVRTDTVVTTDTLRYCIQYMYSEAKERHFTFMLQLYVRSLDIFRLYFDL